MTPHLKFVGRNGQAVRFEDASGNALFEISLDGDRLMVRGIPNDITRQGKLMTPNLQAMPVSSNQLCIQRELQPWESLSTSGLSSSCRRGICDLPDGHAGECRVGPRILPNPTTP